MITIRKIRNTPCGGCDTLNFLMTQVAGEIQAMGASVVEHDISKEPGIVEQYNVGMSVPLMIFEKDGVEVKRTVGVIPPEGILGILKEIAETDARTA